MFETCRYQALAVAGEQPRSQTNDEITSGRKLTPDWHLGLGEAATAIQIIASDKRDVPSTIIFTGMRTICGLLDTGVVIFMKKLDYLPLSSMAFKSSKL
jgi:hypothetical protein